MGSIARARARKTARVLAKHPSARLPVQIDPDQPYGIVTGWCQDEDALPETRRDTHDRLVKLMGDQRTGGVQWQWWEGDAATETLEGMKIDTTDPSLSDMYRRISGLLRERGGLLVIAMAPGRTA